MVAILNLYASKRNVKINFDSTWDQQELILKLDTKKFIQALFILLRNAVDRSQNNSLVLFDLEIINPNGSEV